MAITCTRCGGTGFLNLHQLEDISPEIFCEFENSGDHQLVKDWIVRNDDHDVQVCDCCGDGDDWYGTPGEHYSDDDPMGRCGPYAYNGGLCECH